MKSVQFSIAKTYFDELLDEVERGESVIITRDGRPVARLIPDEDERRRRVQEAIDGIKGLRSANKHATIEEIIAWKNEGRR